MEEKRRHEEGMTSINEAERTARAADLLARAAELFGNREAAEAWLKTPLGVLEGQTPLANVDAEPGARFVQDLIGRLARGVIS